MYESFGLTGIQLHEIYKENFDVSSEGASTCAVSVCINRFVILARADAREGAP